MKPFVTGDPYRRQRFTLTAPSELIRHVNTCVALYAADRNLLGQWIIMCFMVLHNIVHSNIRLMQH